MQYKCQICHDTGNKEKDMGGHLTCIACEAPAERIALESFIESLPAMGEQEQAWRIHQRALAMAPKQEAPAVAFDAATFIENKAAAYLDENSSTDPDDGSTIFHYGSAGSEYYNGLVELAEEIRLAAPAVANGALTDEQINWHTKNIYGTAATAQEVEFAKSILAAAGPDAALVKALERIARWHGEFPDVPNGDGTTSSYALAYGSNGQRDYMRQVALAALSGAKGN